MVIWLILGLCSIDVLDGDFTGKISTFSNRFEEYFRNSWKSGKFSDFQKKRIFATKTSKILKLQKWTPCGSRSPQSKVMSILLKSPEHDIVTEKIIFTAKTTKNYKPQKWNQFCTRSPKSKVMSVLLKSPKYDVVPKKKGFSPLKFQKIITSKNGLHLY